MQVETGVANRKTATTLREVMTREVVSVEKEQCLPVAQELMRLCRIKHLPVVDKGAVVGVVTRTDLLDAQLILLERLGRESVEDVEIALPVAKVMKTNVETVSPEETIAGAMARMVEHHHHCLPVIEAGKLVGIVTETDLLKYSADTLLGECARSVRVHENHSKPSPRALPSALEDAIRHRLQQPAREGVGTLTPPSLWMLSVLVGVSMVLTLVLFTRSVDQTRPMTAFAAMSQPEPGHVADPVHGPTVDEGVAQIVAVAASPPETSPGDLSVIAEEISAADVPAQPKPAAPAKRPATRRAVNADADATAAAPLGAGRSRDVAAPGRQAETAPNRPPLLQDHDAAEWMKDRSGEADQRRRLWVPEPLTPRGYVGGPPSSSSVFR